METTLPCITAGLPGTGGAIKARDEDFVVEEIPLYQPSGSGSHLYASITKQGITTKEVLVKLAELLGIRKDDIGYAGIKDKHAVTTQTFSIPLGRVSEDEAMTAIRQLPVKLNWSKLHANKLKPGHLLGNRFMIRIASLEMPVNEALKNAQRISSAILETGLPNYFGPQRFGMEGDNAERGLKILKGELKVRDRWLSRFLVSSYQSSLCNSYLAKRVESGQFSRILKGDIAKKYATGGLFMVENTQAEQLRYDSKEISFTAPMYGSRMMMARGEAGRLEEQVLEEAGMTMENLAKSGASGTRRLGRLLVNDMEVRACDGGDAIMTGFSLPKGAFATTVLREIMKV